LGLVKVKVRGLEIGLFGIVGGEFVSLLIVDVLVMII
jgi:hypothetical protein